MPGWEEKLSDEQIRAILVWLQSQRPQALYQAWYRMNQQARQKSNTR